MKYFKLNLYNFSSFFVYCADLRDYLKKVNLPHKLVAPNTACWRGYISKWAIDKKKLFLIEWQGYILDYQKVGIEYLFPDEEIIFAKWYTGEIRIGMGDIVNYVHGGYASVYEGETYLIFENGVLVNEYIKWLTKADIEKILEEDKDLPF